MPCPRRDVPDTEARNSMTLHPKLRVMMNAIYNDYRRDHPDDPPPHLIQAYRSCATQSLAVAAGKSRAPYGKSLHGASFQELQGTTETRWPIQHEESTPLLYPCALAFDTGFWFPGTAKADWTPRLFAQLGDIGTRYGLEWGGNWSGIVDGPHLQVPMPPGLVRRVSDQPLFDCALRTLDAMDYPVSSEETTETPTPPIMVVVHRNGKVVEKYGGDEVALRQRPGKLDIDIITREDGE